MGEAEGKTLKNRHVISLVGEAGDGFRRHWLPRFTNALHKVPGTNCQVRLMSVSIVCLKMRFTRV
jgi:hypothetical protein